MWILRIVVNLVTGKPVRIGIFNIRFWSSADTRATLPWGHSSTFSRRPCGATTGINVEGLRIQVTAAKPPAGWYPDDADSSKARWWDGHQWSEQTTQMPGGDGTPHARKLRGRRTRGIAEGALILALFVVSLSMVSSANGFASAAPSAVPSVAEPAISPSAPAVTPTVTPTVTVPTPEPSVSETLSMTCAPYAASPPGVPEVSGMLVSPAASALREAGFDVERQDLSPLDRGIWDADNWTVVATTLEGETVTMWYLRNSEAAWFKANPVMPTIKSGTHTEKLTEEGGVLDDVSELVKYRWAKGQTPPLDKHNDPYVIADDRIGLSAEPKQEVRDRTGLKESGGTDLVHSSRPATQECLRPGRYLVIVEKQSKETKEEVRDYKRSENFERWTPGGRSDDDHKDFNVPGWACPTRWC